MSTVKLDTLFSHSKNVGDTNERLGEFCGSPIITLDERAIDIDNLLETDRVIAINSGFTSGAVELSILPGEVICSDGVIRRGTSAEFIGEDFYKYTEPENTRKVGIEEAKLASLAGQLVTWRPDHRTGQTEFALLHEEVA